MLVWIVVIAYCVWCVVAPQTVLRAFEWQMGNKPRFGEATIRIGAVLFMVFLIGLLLVTRHSSS